MCCALCQLGVIKATGRYVYPYCRYEDEKFIESLMKFESISYAFFEELSLVALKHNSIYKDFYEKLSKTILMQKHK